MKQYKVALFIGRFQPFHNGHLYSLNKCLELADNVIVGIGSSQESGTPENPWDFANRARMIASLNLQGQSLKVVAIPDVHDDKKWGDLIMSIITQAGYEPSQVVAVGNNDWTNRILKAIGVSVYESGLYNRDELEGIKIRAMMDEGDLSWKARVPESVVKCLEKYGRSNKN